ncbi:DUF6318 family protein [Blastococcus litoris]|uniref:DUF6318 family protein n=1 Tax=Blastococcus litoris TaxID=2171622 RepID=UPI000E304F5F|nr:DUF6318 family protein [Blastococcus litoris]
MRDLRGLRRTLAVAVVGAALLTGCSEKQQANDTLPSSSAAETSEALPPLGPEDFPVPDEARTKDAAGAEAFLRYWIDLSNHQQDQLNGQPLRELAPDCIECLRIAKSFDDVAAAGQRYDGGHVTLTSVTEPLVGGNEARIAFIVEQQAVRLLDAAGNVVDPGLPLRSDLSSGMSLTWSDAKQVWLVASMTLG